MPEYDDTDRRDDDRYDDDRGGDARVIERAKSVVKGPAIGLILTSVLGLLGVLLGAAQLASGTMDAQFEAQRKQIEADPNLQPAQKQQAKDLLDTYESVVKKGAVPIYVVVTLVSIVTIAGAVQMMGLKGRGLALTGSILSMLPIVSGCCCLGLPIGIWAILALGKPEVKAGFAAVARRSAGGLD
jgi:hypothetical protein